MTPTETAVIDIITRELRLKEGIVTLESNFKEDLGAESLDALEIVVALEDHFNIALPTTMHEKIIIVKDAVNVVLESIK